MSGIIGGTGLPRSGTIDSFTSDNAVNIGKLRIVTGTTTTGASATAGADAGYYINTAFSYSGFSDIPSVKAVISVQTADMRQGTAYYDLSTTAAGVYFACSTQSLLESKTVYWTIIGTAS